MLILLDLLSLTGPGVCRVPAEKSIGGAVRNISHFSHAAPYSKSSMASQRTASSFARHAHAHARVATITAIHCNIARAHHCPGPEPGCSFLPKALVSEKTSGPNLRGVPNRRKMKPVRNKSKKLMQVKFLADVTKLAVIVVNGMSQIYFQSHIWCGLLILAAFAVVDWRMAVLALLGSVCSSAAAALLRTAKGEGILSGMQGFCGALVGVAVFSALGAGWLGFVATVVGGALCAPVTAGIGRIFGHPWLAQFRLPVTTAPFCIIAGLIFWLTAPLRSAAEPMEMPELPYWADFGHSLLTNVSQVVLVDNALGGALIVLGLFLAHWKVGLAAVLGTVLESLVGMVTGEEMESFYHGLIGYSGVLTAIALAAVFLKGTWQPWVAAVAGAILSVPVAYLIQDMGIPVYTWPYVITTWIVLMVAKFIPGFGRA